MLNFTSTCWIARVPRWPGITFRTPPVPTDRSRWRSGSVAILHHGGYQRPSVQASARFQSFESWQGAAAHPDVLITKGHTVRGGLTATNRQCAT